MDDSGPTASIIWFLLLLLVDMFFYGFGAATNNLNYKEVERRANEGNKKSVRLYKIISNPTEYVNTVQLIMTTINVIMGAVYFTLWQRGIYHYLEHFMQIPGQIITVISVVAAILLLLYIILTFGVLLPKKIGARVPDAWSYFCITPVFFITVLLKPITGLVTVTVNALLFLFGFRDSEKEKDITEEELISMVQEGHEQGVLLESEVQMISNIFELGDKEAQNIMTHRKNIVAVDGATMLKDAVAFMLDGKNSRYPVYEENIDHIIGILHLKDAMRFQVESDKNNLPIMEIEGLLREPVFVPQTKNIDELFKEMQSTKLQMVIVIDEYGQTDGLVAMEDILEEIVGNIQDEYDEDTEYIEDKGNDEYIIEGTTPLEDLEERFGISFDKEEFETLNGFMISKMDKIPEPDEEFELNYEGYNFKLLSVEKKMIDTVLVTKLENIAAEEAAAEITLQDRSG